MVFIKIVGTANSANEVFHCVHFECPSQLSTDLLQTMIPITNGEDQPLTSGLSLTNTAQNFNQNDEQQQLSRETSLDLEINLNETAHNKEEVI